MQNDTRGGIMSTLCRRVALVFLTVVVALSVTVSKSAHVDAPVSMNATMYLSGAPPAGAVQLTLTVVSVAVVSTTSVGAPPLNDSHRVSARMATAAAGNSQRSRARTFDFTPQLYARSPAVQATSSSKGETAERRMGSTRRKRTGEPRLPGECCGLVPVYLTSQRRPPIFW